MSKKQKQHQPGNRLINETSPYLLQHAHNPVDWYPWGEEAWQRARDEDMPVLLSIGYSACHWCHVMAHESFENERIAAMMNQNFVCIKVDREERPDIDHIYMQAVQAMSFHGGWPMTVFLLPNGRPFYGGTYFPPKERYGMPPSFSKVLFHTARVFRERRAELEAKAEELAAFLKAGNGGQLRPLCGHLPGMPEYSSLLEFSEKIAESFDEEHGGFGEGPKFPNTMALEFFLRIHLHKQNETAQIRPLRRGTPASAAWGRDPLQRVRRGGYNTGDQEEEELSELEMVELSLQRMARGGIYDQLGGGFHRYAVDEEWLVPHFEKTLYDNALLSRLYLHTYLVTKNPFYRRITEETLDYVLREMTSPEGGFYSTQDADSEGEEGKFYVWTPKDILRAIDINDVKIFMRYYGVTDEGNFEGKSILHIAQDEEEVAKQLGLSVQELQASLERSRQKLLAIREKRVMPGRDEKILTSWNGLMVRSFAEAARYLQRPDYLQVAIKNANFLLDHLREDGRLLRSHKDGRAHPKGFLEDYAFFADGLLALYEASSDIRWFKETITLMNEMLALFADEQNGGFYDTAIDQEELMHRPKELMDSTIPAGNSVAADVLLRLAAMSGKLVHRQRAEEYLQALADVIIHPQAFCHALGTLDFALSPCKQIVIVGDPQSEDTQALLSVVNQHYLPNSVLICASPTDQQAIETISLLEDKSCLDGKATAYVCEGFACQAPVTSPNDLEHYCSRHFNRAQG